MNSASIDLLFWSHTHDRRVQFVDPGPIYMHAWWLDHVVIHHVNVAFALGHAGDGWLSPCPALPYTRTGVGAPDRSSLVWSGPRMPQNLMECGYNQFMVRTVQACTHHPCFTIQNYLCSAGISLQYRAGRVCVPPLVPLFCS